MNLIAGSQTAHVRFKSVTDEIMENWWQFIRLRTHTWKTLGHYCMNMFVDRLHDALFDFDRSGHQNFAHECADRDCRMMVPQPFEDRMNFFLELSPAEREELHDRCIIGLR